MEEKIGLTRKGCRQRCFKIRNERITLIQWLEWKREQRKETKRK
jgi:hypothetical protein